MEKTFAEGIYFDKPHEKSPDFVKGKISLQKDKLIDFVTKHANEKGYVNLDVKESREGKVYIELNTWKPEESKKPDYPEGDVKPEDIPF